jgi:hypothetical protein
MKQNRHIALFVVVISFFMIPVSCSRAPEESEKRGLETVDIATKNETEEKPVSDKTLEQAFETDTLTIEQLTAFQQRGAEKLADFINYIELLSNKRYDPRLRLEARKQASALFPDVATPITIAINDEKKKRSIPAFLDDIYKSKYDSIKVKTDSIILQQPQRGEGFSYTGHISANVRVTGYKNKKIIYSSSALREAAILIQKIEKDFGGEKKQVWEVMLGEMK